MIGVKAEITPETRTKLTQLERNFTPEGFKKFARKAMRSTSAAVRKDLIGHLGDRYRLGAVGGFSKIARTRSGMTDDSMVLRVRGSRVPLVEFMTDKGTNTRAKGHYGEQPTVDIKGTASMQPGDFYARANVKARVGGAPSYHGMIFRPEGGYYNARYSLGKRVGAGRQKVKALMTVSAPNMMNADEVKGKVQASAGRRAATAMEKAVDNAFQSAT